MGSTLSIGALRPTDYLAVAAVAAFLFWATRPRSRGTKLRGPPRLSFLWGQSRHLREIDLQDGAAADLQVGWTDQYGSVFMRPGPLGKYDVVVTDPKAVAHIYAGMETTYEQTKFRAVEVGAFLGKQSIINVHGDVHKRQRRALAPGFTNTKIREYTSIFLDSAYKVKAAWDAKFENEGGDVIECNVTPWMNAISLDSMGLAGFSHDFGALGGQRSLLRELFDAFASAPLSLMSIVVLLLAPAVPALSRLPTQRAQLRNRFSGQSGVIARELLAKTAEGEGTIRKDDRSILGLLIRASTAQTGFPLSEQEVNDQMKTLMVAGYETTSVSMTWALIELCRRPELQKKLRDELRAAHPSSDPTFDELSQGLPMLDAIVHETLRLHPAVPETVRMPAHDDILPLGTPLVLSDGQTTDHVVIQAKQSVAIPISAINRMPTLWGPDAREFKPERWLDSGAGIPAAAKEVQGHRHLVTFIDGPRNCIGKGFAVAEFKAVLSVLVRNYEFELPNGPKTYIQKDIALVGRPTVEGMPRTTVPLRIRRVEQE